MLESEEDKDNKNHGLQTLQENKLGMPPWLSNQGTFSVFVSFSPSYRLPFGPFLNSSICTEREVTR